jgi:hypothetical protein
MAIKLTTASGHAVDIPLPSPKAIGLGVAIGLVGFWIFAKYSREIARGAAEGVVGAADGIISGTVIATGQVFGIPDTDQAKCVAAMANGQKMAASQFCPAGRFIRWIWAGMPAEGVPE